MRNDFFFSIKLVIQYLLPATKSRERLDSLEYARLVFNGLLYVSHLQTPGSDASGDSTLTFFLNGRDFPRVLRRQNRGTHTTKSSIPPMFMTLISLQ
jgi:hypothetical protein